jgi:hypothetical protein
MVAGMEEWRSGIGQVLGNPDYRLQRSRDNGQGKLS